MEMATMGKLFGAFVAAALASLIPATGPFATTAERLDERGLVGTFALPRPVGADGKADNDYRKAAFRSRLEA